jgi:hypothetical protein
MPARRLAPALLVLLLTATGCAPSLSPLFRDYDIEPAPATAANDDVYARLRAALTEAGWTVTESDVPNLLATEPRRMSNWGLYRTDVTLEAAPVNNRHVRVFFHPFRTYITGGRSKMAFLDGGLQRALIPELNRALEAHGFLPLGAPRGPEFAGG